jgi:hypothetical protein
MKRPTEKPSWIKRRAYKSKCMRDINTIKNIVEAKIPTQVLFFLPGLPLYPSYALVESLYICQCLLFQSGPKQSTENL